MEDNLNPIPENPKPVSLPDFIAGGREFAFGAAMVLIGIFMCNFVLYGGFHVGFAVMAMASIACTWLYLRRKGRKFGAYERTLLILSLVIAAGFGRSDDFFVKFFMLLFLFVAVNLAFGIGTGQNRRDPNGAMSLLDAPRVFYVLGIGSMGKSGNGIVTGFRQGGAATRKFGAITTGLLASIPLVIVMVVLLMRADAAFEGLVDLLPEVDVEEYILSGFWGLAIGWILYSRGLALNRNLKPQNAESTRMGANALTVNTILSMVCLVYVVYLFSQLAYLSGGLSGILPEEYTLAEYARRGFFEMAWLSAMNLGILCGVMWLLWIQGKLPRVTRIAGTFLGMITIFLILTASAKMFLYIGSYGLTRLRVTTEVIMLWLAITTVLVTLRLFLRKLPYMKAVVLTAMVLGTLVFWVDVNTFVADYNMRAYRSGKLETIDVRHLGDLGSPAVKHLVELTEDSDPLVAEKARDILGSRSYNWDDFREWNYDRAKAAEEMTGYREVETARVRGYLLENLGVEITGGELTFGRGYRFHMDDGLRFLRLEFDVEESEALMAQLADAGWTELPVGVLPKTLVSGNQSLFGQFASYYSIIGAQQGYWVFRDLHPDSETEKNIHIRDGYRFQLACYNADTQKLYFFEADTLPEAK